MATDLPLGCISPSDPTHEGCAVRVKTRHLTTDKGVVVTAVWPLRLASGAAADISSLIAEEQTDEEAATARNVRVRFMPLGAPDEACETYGKCTDPVAGTVQFDLPATVTDKSGIYHMQIGICDVEDRLRLVDKGLIFVEPSLFGDWTEQRDGGPPGLKEIRTYIRDTRLENDFLKDVEFSDEEIINAIVAPIREWNEMLPPVAPFTPRTFPYREMWIKGILGNLCRMAAAWYSRNRMQTAHGGISIDDRNKHQEYDARAQMYLQEWRTFARAMKVRINISRGYGLVAGPYW